MYSIYLFFDSNNHIGAFCENQFLDSMFYNTDVYFFYSVHTRTIVSQQ